MHRLWLFDVWEIIEIIKIIEIIGWYMSFVSGFCMLVAMAFDSQFGHFFFMWGGGGNFSFHVC